MLLAEKTLKQKESQLFVKQEQESEFLRTTDKIFLPDSLEFGCKTGFYLFKVSAPPLQSYWMLPKQ